MAQYITINENQKDELIQAIISGGGGTSAPVVMDATQWAQLISALSNQQTYTANKVLQADADGHISSSNLDISSLLELFNPSIRTLNNNYCDITYFRVGIIKCIMILGNAKQIIPAGWLPTPALGILPDDMTSLLGSFNLNTAYRGAYITMGLGNTNVLNMNSSSQIASGTAIRISLWYI